MQSQVRIYLVSVIARAAEGLYEIASKQSMGGACAWPDPAASTFAFGSCGAAHSLLDS